MSPNKSGAKPPDQSPDLQPKPLKSKRNGKTCKKAERYRPGERFLQQVRQLEESQNWLTPQAQFGQIVREITLELVGYSEIRYQAAALRALHEAYEAFRLGIVEDAYRCIHGTRDAPKARDIQLAHQIRGESGL